MFFSVLFFLSAQWQKTVRNHGSTQCAATSKLLACCNAKFMCTFSESHSLAVFVWLLAAGSAVASLGPADCAALPACPLPRSEHFRSNETVLISVEDCCWNATFPQRNPPLVVYADRNAAQNIVVSFRRVVALDLMFVASASDNEQNLTRFPASNGWGIVDVAIFDSYVEVANEGTLLSVVRCSAASLSFTVAGSVVYQVGNQVSPNSGFYSALLVVVDSGRVNSITVSVADSVILSTGADESDLVYTQGVTGLDRNTHTCISIQFVSTIVNVSAVSVARRLQSSASQSLVRTIASRVTGEIRLVGSLFRIYSAAFARLVFMDRCDVHDLRLLVHDATAAVSSYGSLTPRRELREAILFLFRHSSVTNADVTIANVNATATVALGARDGVSVSNTIWTEATFLCLYGCRICNITIRDVFFRGRAIGGDIAPTGGFSDRASVQLAGVVFHNESFAVQNVSIVIERVRFDAFVQATSSEPAFVARAFFQLVYLVQVAASCIDVFISISNCHVSRWADFPDRTMLLDSRLTFIAALVDASAGAGGKELLAATRATVVVANVTIACMDSEWADTSLVGKSGTQIGARVSVSDISSYRLTAASAPTDFRSDDFALRFGIESFLVTAAVDSAALIWSAVAFTGPLSVGGGSVLTITQLRACPMSRLVAPMYMRYGVLTGHFTPPSLSVPDAASITCINCVLGFSVLSGLRPSPVDAPAVMGLKAPVIGMHVAMLNVTFDSLLRAEYFVESEVTSIKAAAPRGFQGRQLTIDCNYHHNGTLVEPSAAVRSLFNVTNAGSCSSPTSMLPSSPPIPQQRSTFLQDNPEVVATAAFATVVLSAVFQGAKPSFLQVSKLLMSLSSSDGCLPQFDAMASPTTIVIAPGIADDDNTAVLIGKAQGAVVGNVLVLLGNLLGWLLLGVGVAALRQRRMPRRAVIHLVGEGCSVTSIPGGLITCLTFLLQPTVEAAVFLFAASRDRRAVFVGCCGVVSMIAPCILALLAVVSIPCTCVLQKKVRRKKRACYPFPLPRLVSEMSVSFLTPLYRWVPQPASRIRDGRLQCFCDKSARSAIQYQKRYGPLFENYRGGRAVWFLGLELLIPVVCGCISGVAEVIGCGVSAQLLLAFASFVLVASLACRPFVARLLNVSFSLSAAVTVLCSAFLVGGDESTAAAIALLQVAFSLAALCVSWAVSIRYGTSRLWNLFCSVWAIRKKGQSASSPVKYRCPRASVSRSKALEHLIVLACAHQQGCHTHSKPSASMI